MARAGLPAKERVKRTGLPPEMCLPGLSMNEGLMPGVLAMERESPNEGDVDRKERYM